MKNKFLIYIIILSNLIQNISCAQQLKLNQIKNVKCPEELNIKKDAIELGCIICNSKDIDSFKNIIDISSAQIDEKNILADKLFRYHLIYDPEITTDSYIIIFDKEIKKILSFLRVKDVYGFEEIETVSVEKNNLNKGYGYISLFMAFYNLFKKHKSVSLYDSSKSLGGYNYYEKQFLMESELNSKSKILLQEKFYDNSFFYKEKIENILSKNPALRNMGIIIKKGKDNEIEEYRSLKELINLNNFKI